uniref:Dolichyl-diphosphooligosaccharide--protein glycosyltransferase 48 kDa subunit n=1 Tax=Meloidogyne incognita TaxID=6306 RepID=A0A914M4K4_MELIC
MFKTLIFLLLLSSTIADRILLLVDNSETVKTHSEFIKSIEGRGHTIKTSQADSSDLALIKFGELLFEHLIILAPSVDEFGGAISVSEISNFIDKGGNVFFTGGYNMGDAIKDLAAEVGFEFDDDKTSVIDHFSYDANLDNGNHTTIIVPNTQLVNAPLITGVGNSKLGPLLYRGVSLIAEGSNPLRFVIMTASSTAFSFNPKNPVEETPGAVGKSTILIGAMQARNNARVLVSGSIDFFSNEFINANAQKAGTTEKSKSGNSELAKALSMWVLKEEGVLRIKTVKHHVVGQTTPPTEYTIMDNVHYEINIEELKSGKWLPFKGDDVQLEFVRIDPFVRTTLKNNNGRLSTTFKVPDVYGVFKFLVDYHRIGYTHLYDVQQVSVRPLKHTQYERFSRCAYPYYVSAFSMMIGLILFSFVFLYYKEPKDVTSQTTTTKSGQGQKAKTS